MDQVDVLGVKVDVLHLEDVLSAIARTIDARQRALIAYVHVSALCNAYQQEWLRNFYNCADLVYCDGMGVQLGARILGKKLPERFALTDWVWDLAEMASARGYRLFLLGNPPGVAERAALKLRERFPDLMVSGTAHGYFDKTPGCLENEALIEKVNSTHADILLVGFGVPLQEKWLKENWSHLQTTIALSCGALFEYITGDLRRGPRWMIDHYLEWLARIIISPRRYFRRYLVDNARFLKWIIRQSMRQ